MAVIRLRRKLQIRKPPYLNTVMGKCLSLKPGADIPIMKEAEVGKSEIFSTALKDGSKLVDLHGKHSVDGKENLLPVKKKAEEAEMVIIGAILSMQYALVRTRSFTAISMKAFIQLHFLTWPISLIVLAVC